METEIAECIEIIRFFSSLNLLRFETQIALFKSIQVDIDGVVAINCRVLRPWIWLVEIIRVVHESRPDGIEHDGSVWPNKNGNCTSTTSRACWAFSINSDVRAYHKPISSIVGLALDPVKSIENSIG